MNISLDVNKLIEQLASAEYTSGRTMAENELLLERAEKAEKELGLLRKEFENLKATLDDERESKTFWYNRAEELKKVIGNG